MKCIAMRKGLNYTFSITIFVRAAADTSFTASAGVARLIYSVQQSLFQEG